jgi:hypothetical protein
MVAHGLCSSGLFCLSNISYERFGSRSLLISRGLINLIPRMAMFDSRPISGGIYYEQSGTGMRVSPSNLLFLPYHYLSTNATFVYCRHCTVLKVDIVVK